MNNYVKILMSAAVVLLVGSSFVADEGVLEFKSLFNGKDLTGWVNVNTSKDTWNVQDGILVCSGHPIGVMRSEKQYENFIVDLARVYGEAGRSLVDTRLASVCDRSGWKVRRVRPERLGWWVPLEWSPKWGMWTRGGYQMQIAWLFDGMLEAARVRGEKMPFVLVSDAAFFEEGKFRWSMNPLNSSCGGELDAPGSYFLQTKEGWVHAPEGTLPGFVGFWMDVFGMAGPGEDSPSVDWSPSQPTRFCQSA